MGSLPDPRGLDRPQAQGQAQDRAGQAHAAKGPGEQLGIFGKAAPPDRSVGAKQIEPIDEVAETAVAVVVLAVDIGRRHSAQRDEFGSRGYIRKPAARQERIDHIGEHHARFGDQLPGSLVEGQHPVETAHGDRRRRDGAIAIGPAVAARDRAVPADRLAQPGEVARRGKPHVVDGKTAETGEDHGAFPAAGAANTNRRSSRYLTT